MHFISLAAVDGYLRVIIFFRNKISAQIKAEIRPHFTEMLNELASDMNVSSCAAHRAKHVMWEVVFE